jgi:GDP/UDP-N,N'-diacetylbacillosamine 2-epimerase (hydrolysing)
VIQLGEQPERVFNVGGLGIDNILRLKLLTREELETALDFKLAPRNLLITFHPVTLEQSTSAKQMDELLAALAELEDVGLIFTMPNADTEGRVLFRQIEDFCRLHPNARAYTSLGLLRYLSCIQLVDGVVGNSSSGLAEVPSFKKGTINIGDRQRGRLRANSVIDCVPERQAIAAALSHLFSEEFQRQLPATKNPYGDGGSSQSIVKTLEEHPLDNLLKKRFYDIPLQ